MIISVYNFVHNFFTLIASFIWNIQVVNLYLHHQTISQNPTLTTMATKKPASKAKLMIETPAPKKVASRKMPIDEYIAKLTGGDDSDDDGDGEEKEGFGKIEMILRLWKKGYTRKEIVGAGFNKSTVYRQTGEYDKLNGGPVKSYYGLEAYEGRIQRVMRTKSLSRDKAADYIAELDAAVAETEKD